MSKEEPKYVTHEELLELLQIANRPKQTEAEILKTLACLIRVEKQPKMAQKIMGFSARIIGRFVQDNPRFLKEKARLFDKAFDTLLLLQQQGLIYKDQEEVIQHLDGVISSKKFKEFKNIFNQKVALRQKKLKTRFSRLVAHDAGSVVVRDILSHRNISRRRYYGD